MFTRVSKSVSDAGLHLMNFDNAIINGDFSVWQRGESFTCTYGSTKIADMWYLTTASSVASIVVTKVTGDGPEDQDFLRITTSTPETDDSWSDFTTLIEGLNIRTFKYKPICVSFWIRSSITGTMSISLRSVTGVYSCVREITINQANTWEKKEILALPSLSTIGLEYFTFDNTKGLTISCCLSANSSRKTSNLSMWHIGNYIAGPNQINFTDTSGVTIDFANFKINAGNIVTPFEYLPMSITNLLCKRYYNVLIETGGIAVLGTGYNGTTTTGRGLLVYDGVEMRTSPTGEAIGTFKILSRNTYYTISDLSLFPTRYGRTVYTYGLTAAAVQGEGHLITTGGDDTCKIALNADFV